MAYDLHSRQIVGGPAWIETEKFDVTAKPDVPGQPSVAQIKILIESLLADRFQLKFHREKKGAERVRNHGWKERTQVCQERT
jgi:uncharacterized protein (TIGR03435 family)